MIKAITFDLWNTLLEDKDFTKHRINSLSRILSVEGFQIPKNDLLTAYRSASDHYREIWEINHRHLHVDRRVEYMLKQLEIELTDNVKLSIIEEFTEAFSVDPPAFKEDVKEVLESLRENYVIGIISDTGVTPGSIIRGHLRRCGVLKFFSSTAFSDEVGFCKPDSRVFEKALRELMIRPDEAVHVGDLLRTDVAGAKNVGMKSVWLSNESNMRYIDCTSDYVIKRLSELLDILDQF